MGKDAYSVETVFEKRLTVEAYARLKGDVKFFIDDVLTRAIKSNKTLRINKKKALPKQEDVWQLSWLDIITLRNNVKEQRMFEVIQVLYMIKPNEFLRLDIFNCFAVYKWITQQLSDVAEAEERLASEPSSDEKAAGVEQLEEFDYAVSLDVIAKGDVLKYNAILEQPYAVIFQKLCLEKTKNEIQQNLIENARREIKANY